MTYILGITGGIASGKSLATTFFKEQGFLVLDGDKIAREVVKKESPLLKEIVEAFGTLILDEHQELNRKKLGTLIFEDEKKRKQLNHIMGKAIRDRFLKGIQQAKKDNEKLLILDIPLLFEAGYLKDVDETMVISVSEKTQLKRLQKRDHLSKERALLKINAQFPLAQKEKWADIVISNEGKKEETYRQLCHWLTNFKKSHH